jgi:HK97 family phage prohead protease
MPWHVAKSAQCPASKPWGVIKDADGSLVACHATEASAQKQVDALYANESSYGRSEGESSLEVHYRSFTPDLQVRASDGGRTVYGIAVPYNAPTRINDQLVETFARGAFDHQFLKPQRVKFAREHVLLGGEIIGAASKLANDAAGLYVEMRVANTKTGNDTLELIKDGALDQLSIMFREGKNRRLGGNAVERLRADLREVAVVMEGAYGELATAAGVRSAQLPQAAIDLDLRAQAEEFLVGGLPEPSDHDLEIRKIRLGLPF